MAKKKIKMCVPTEKTFAEGFVRFPKEKGTKTTGGYKMKRVIALCLVFLMMLCLCACRESQEEKIATILTQNSWYSPDREYINQLSDDWTIVLHSYTLTFFEDGSLRGDCLKTETGVFNEEDEMSYTGTWSVDGNSVIMDFGHDETTVFIYTEDNVLHAPQAEGYTYLPMNHTND